MTLSFFITILGLIIISSSIFVYSFSLSEGYVEQQQQQKSTIATITDKEKENIILEIKNASTNPIVTKFLIGNEVYNQICAKGQCSIKYDPSASAIFSLPTENYPFMYHSFPFTIEYYCEDNGIDTSITRIYDNKKWHFDAIEKYDAESDIFTLNGTLTRN